MCESKTCDDDYCCADNCADLGGLRHCEQCDERLAGFHNDAYRGCQTVSRSGKVCQRWDAQTPHAHTMSLASHPTADLRENFCRNPSGEEDIWCYTTSPDTPWEFCNVLPSLGPARAPLCGISLPLIGTREHGHLPDAKITASSYLNNAGTSGRLQMWRSRLTNTDSTWTAESTDEDPWIQWEFAGPKQIQRIETKGRSDTGDQWVTEYKLAFSGDGDKWTMVDDTFEANSDKDSMMENTLDPPIVATMLRLYPTNYHESISLRAELFGCIAPQQLTMVYPKAECCSGTKCDESTNLPNYVSWATCHDQCQTSPECVGFQFGRKNDDSEIDRCTAPTLCSCWLITGGACSNAEPNKAYDAYLFQNPTTPMRLVQNPTTPDEVWKGRVELYHNGEWGSVCNDLFTRNAALVVCWQLGMQGGKLLETGSFPIGSGPIWMDQVACTGHEEKIWKCPFNGWGSHNCNHAADVGVECARPPPGALVGEAAVAPRATPAPHAVRADLEAMRPGQLTLAAPTR